MISEKYLREIFKFSLSPLMILLPNAPVFSILELNDACLLLGKNTAETLAGNGAAIFFNQFDFAGWDTILQNMLLQKKSYKGVTVPLKLTGSPDVAYWDIDIWPVTDEGDEVEFLICAFTDVTAQTIERRNAAQTLADIRGQLNSLLETIGGAAWEAEADTLQFTFVSDHAEQILGFAPEDWLTQPHFREKHIHPADKEQAAKYRGLKNQKNKNHLFEYRMINSVGGIVWIKDFVSVMSKNGKQVWLRGLMQDVTEAKRASSIERLEKDVLELNSRNSVTVQEVLLYYLTGVEQMFPKMKCSILQVKNNQLHNWASPSLPPAYIAAVEDMPIGDNVGSCGTAVFLKQQVIVSDIESDMRWVNYKHIAATFGLRACWSHPVINASGDVMAVLGMYYDEVKAPDEDELKVIERVTALLRIILENRQKTEIIEETTLLMMQGQELAHFGTWSWDVKNNVVTWSDTLYQIYGVSRKQFKATFEGYQELLHPDDRERVYGIIGDVLKTGNDVEFEEKIIRPTGEMRHLKSWAKLKKNEAGQPEKMIGACLDITENKNAERELRISNERYEYVNKATNDAIFDWDLVNDRVKLGNSFFRLFGFHNSMQDYSFGQWATQVHPADIKQVENKLQTLFNDSTQDNWSDEYRFKKANGQYAYIEGNGYIIRDKAGRAIKMIGVMKDITEMQEHISNIEKQNEKLLQIAWMQSHGVRAPLAKIMGLVDLLKDPPDNDAEKTQLLTHLLQSAYELDTIVKTISQKTDHII